MSKTSLENKKIKSLADRLGAEVYFLYYGSIRQGILEEIVIERDNTSAVVRKYDEQVGSRYALFNIYADLEDAKDALVSEIEKEISRIKEMTVEDLD